MPESVEINTGSVKFPRGALFIALGSQNGAQGLSINKLPLNTTTMLRRPNRSERTLWLSTCNHGSWEPNGYGLCQAVMRLENYKRSGWAYHQERERDINAREIVSINFDWACRASVMIARRICTA